MESFVLVTLLGLVATDVPLVPNAPYYQEETPSVLAPMLSEVDHRPVLPSIENVEKQYCKEGKPRKIIPKVVGRIIKVKPVRHLASRVAKIRPRRLAVVGVRVLFHRRH